MVYSIDPKFNSYIYAPEEADGVTYFFNPLLITMGTILTNWNTAVIYVFIFYGNAFFNWYEWIKAIKIKLSFIGYDLSYGGYSYFYIILWLSSKG